MRFRLLPTDEGFFDLFNSAAANVADCGRRLRELLEQSEPGGDATIEAVIACEQHGDELTRDIMRRLNTSFVTPFDREDIHALAEELDDVVDDMLEVAYRLELGDRDVAVMPELKQQADLLVQMADHVALLDRRPESMKGLQPHLDAIDRLESEGDVDLPPRPAAAVLRRVQGPRVAVLEGRRRGDGATPSTPSRTSPTSSRRSPSSTPEAAASMELLGVVIVIGIALAFDFVNGFHDAANSIATVVSTRVLSPRLAVIWAAFFNFVAFLVFGTVVAATIATGVVDPDVCRSASCSPASSARSAGT